jgi:ABC-type Co2+ transport system, periplasmic component
MGKIKFRDTTDLMVYGHEAWLEMGASHAHTGEESTIYLKYGHNMKVDGLARREGIEALVVRPDGKSQAIRLEEGSAEYHLLKFTPAMEGLYNVVAKHPGNYAIDKEGKYHKGTRQDCPDAVKAVHYLQFAQTIVPAGHDLEAAPPAAGTPLEIKAGHWKSWRAGDVLEFTVLFRGDPLDGINVDLALDGPGGYRQWQK